MFSLQLSDEQKALRSLARRFAEKEIRPVAMDLDRRPDDAARVPLDVLRKGSQLGLRNFSLSQQFGGLGIDDDLTACLVAEELGCGDLGVAYFFTLTNRRARDWFPRMSPGQRERFLPEFLADDLYHFAVCYHEPDTDLGWDYFRPVPSGLRHKTTARQDSDGSWIINGAKNFQTNGMVANLLLVYASTEEENKAFLVPADTPGIVRREISKVGRRLGSNAEIFLEDVKVPQDSFLAAPPKGEPPGAGGIVAAMTLGVGRAALEDALEYTKVRVQGGKPIVQHQMVGAALADIAIALEAARMLIWRAAWERDDPERTPGSGLPMDAVASVFTADAVHAACVKALNLFGGMGIATEVPIQKYVRDALVQVTTSFPFPSRLRIAEALAGYRYPDSVI